MISELVFQGLEENVKEFYKHTLDGLMEQVPDDSSVCSTIKKMGHRYVGVLNIFSSGVRFVGQALCNTPQETVNTLVKQIQDQIRDWHHKRFAEREIGEAFLLVNS